MDIDPKYYPLIASIIAGIIGLVGIAIGTFLSEIRTWFENRRNDKRILKSTLFHQLELFGETLAFDRDLAKDFSDALKTVMLNMGSPQEITEQLFQNFPRDLFRIIETAKADSLKDAVEKHNEIIIKLSEVDPLFASNWSYRSRSRFPDQMKIFLNEASVVSTEKNEVTDKFLEHIQEWFQEKSHKRLLTSLESGIIEIAWRIDIKTWWKIKREISKWRQKTKDDIQKEAQEYVLEMINFYIKNFSFVEKHVQNTIEEAKINKQKQKKIITEE